MRIVDLSFPIQNTPPGTPEPMRVQIEYSDHQAGAREIATVFGIGPKLLRDGEGWATDTFTHLGTHASTHVDAPRHYNSVVGGQPAQSIDQLPLEWFFSSGVVLDFRHKRDGDAVSAQEVQVALGRSGHSLQPLDVVLVQTGRDAFVGEADYWLRGPGVSAEATRWLFAQGVRVVGIDAWGWDAPLDRQAAQAQALGDQGVFWAAHQVDLPYAQLERLTNLAALPTTGFRVACFPLKLTGGSAASARVVAILDDGVR